jgi:hypothetical protein
MAEACDTKYLFALFGCAYSCLQARRTCLRKAARGCPAIAETGRDCD